jgi:hypothetical protein
MTSLDAEFAELASRIDSLSKRSLVGLFWACSSALVPAFRAWAAHRGAHTELLLRSALASAHSFATQGIDPQSPAHLLASIEASTPAGNSPDEVSATSAQDCWICADVAIRVLVDEAYRAGPAIEYALEPVLSAASEELFGVSQLGTSDEEEEQVRLLLRHREVAAALEFVRWATAFLQDRPLPAEEDLAIVGSRAAALAS